MESKSNLDEELLPVPELKTICTVDTKAATNTSGMAVLIHGKTCFVAGGKGFKVYDVSSEPPSEMCEMIDTGVLSRDGKCSLALDEDRQLLFLMGGKGLAVFDVKQPASPAKIYSEATGVASIMSGGDLILNGKTLFVSGGKGLAVFDVSDPSGKPQRISKQETGVSERDGYTSIAMDKERNLLFFAGTKGLGVFDIKDPGAPQHLCKIDTGVLTRADPRHGSGGGGSVVLQGDIAYVAGGKGFTSFDTSDPAAPKQMCTIQTGAGTYGGGATVAVMGEVAIVAGGHGVAYVDISDPAAMIRKAFVKTGTGTYAGVECIQLTESRAYIGGGSGLSVVDISDVAAFSAIPLKDL